MSGKVKLTGVGDLKKKFAQMTMQAQSKVGRRGLAGAAIVLRQEMRSRAPRDTGNLRKNIRYKIRRQRRGYFKGRVGVSGEAFYAKFIEFGTSPHRIPAPSKGRGKNKEKNDRRVSFDGGVYTSVKHPGTPARPFLRPAFDAGARRAIEEVKKRLWAGIREAL